MEVELPLPQSKLLSTGVGEPDDFAENSPKSSNGFHDTECNGNNGFGDHLDEFTEKDLVDEDKENVLNENENEEYEGRSIDTNNLHSHDDLTVDTESLEQAEKKLETDCEIESSALPEGISVEPIDNKDVDRQDLTDEKTTKDGPQSTDAVEQSKNSIVIELVDEPSDDEKPLSSLFNREKVTPNRVVTAATPRPSEAVHTDTPYPFLRVSARRGLHDPNNSFDVRSEPSSPGVMNFPRLRKFDGQTALNFFTEDSRKRRRDAEELESPDSKRSKQGWLGWVNPLKWFSSDDTMTDNAEASPLNEGDEPATDVINESTSQRRTCAIM